MSDLARQLIRENIEKHRRGEDARTLDLGNCGMTEIPEEIGECVWVEKLILSDEWDEYDTETNEWIQKNSSNRNEKNALATLPSGLNRLTVLKRIVFCDSQISDLSPLSEMMALQELNCSYSPLADLEPLSGLMALQRLNCSSTQVFDLSSLSKLSMLQQLDCSGTKVSDLEPLSKLSRLEELDCSWTEVSNLGPLSMLISLKQLKCSSRQISDLMPLSGLTTLQVLNCSSTQVSDLSPLVGLTALQQLNCSSTQVSNLKPLAHLVALKILQCYQTQVSDLTFVSELINLSEFDCSATQISNLGPLAGLISLQKLDCSETQIPELSPLSQLIMLREIYCGKTQIFDLSPLSGLSALQELSIGNTQVSDLSSLSGLSALQELNCWNTEVCDLSPLTGLSALQKLSLGNTQVSDLSFLSGLSSLQELDCWNTQIADLSPLSGLTILRRLNCFNTQVSDLSALCGLKTLEYIDCTRTQVSDLSPLVNMADLKVFFCSNTPVSDLSPLGRLTNVQQIDCFSTKVSDLSPLLSQIVNGTDIWWKNLHEYYQDEFDPNRQHPAILVRDCPLICPPVEFAMESPEAVRDYFEELGEDGRRLNEVKVVFLGEASAGKTSLVKQLMGEQFDSKESQTHGIRIRKMDFAMSDGDTVAAHLWDFGGQEVMHATHQFFLSQRSVYVLLLNSRNDDQAEKWLKYAASFGGRSPVLVVLNKIDENPSFEVNRKTLREKYPQIREFYRLSCKNEAGIDDFREALRREIENADTRRTPFPSHWLAVKEHFSNMKADYIESAEYRRVCEQNGVLREFSQDVLLKFLHDLGVVINFHNIKNFDTQILNPLWLTNGVYRIINSKRVAETGGLLHENEFDAVINDPRYRDENTADKPFHYPKNKLQYIVRVMQDLSCASP
jgi:small GTP-binding protein